ncbi:MAG TPA: hypothetical protein VH835_01635 [Dongiaceae bacterium]|jgi:hypothetical protein
MKGAVLAALVGATALVPLPSLAQTGAPAQPAGGGRGPANLCQELVAYVRQATAPAPGAAQAAAAAQSPQPSPAQQVAPTAAPTAPATAAAAQPPGKDAPSQSGIPGPVPQAQTQGTPGPQAAGQNPAVTQPQTPAAAQPGGQAPPPAQAAAAAPPAPPQAPKPTAEHLAKLEAAAQGNDLAACRNYGQQMRRAGMPMPPPLLALAGLDLKYLQQAQPPQQQ